jgi:ribonuclease D
MEPTTTPSSKPPAVPPSYTWVDTEHHLHQMLEILSKHSRIALDMEADSLYHYFEKVCLIQLSSESNTFILDPLVVKDLGALAPLLANPSIEKVFHAAGYDIFCLKRDYGFAFAKIFDTHIAAQFMGYEFLGLAALLDKLLGIVHSKQRQKDNWSIRPLNDEQIKYAAMDTHYLLQLRDLLEAQLREKGRLHWAEEEFEAAALNKSQERDFDPEGFRRIKGSRKLPLQSLATLRALYLLRDKYARDMDVPPFKVMNNSILIDLASKPPQTQNELFRRPGLSRRLARKHGKEILQAITETLSQDPSFLKQPPRKTWKGFSRESNARLENLKIWRSEKAKQLGLQVGVVFPGSSLEILANAQPSNLNEMEQMQGMRHWRVEEFGDEILKILHR